MNILFVGDVVGKPGRRVLSRLFSELTSELEAEVVVVNVENAAGGFGMSKKIHDQMVGLGADVLTSGNHIWDRREFVKEIEDCGRIVRPANFAPEVPGRGHVIIETDPGPIAVVNLAGRVFMPPAECPFRAADRVIEALDDDVKMILVDFHAEATSEKEALGYYLDGRVTAVIGTHTHVQTNDAKVLPKGSAFLSDAGMTGPSNSVIGVKIEPVLDKFITGMPNRFETATGAAELNGCLVTCDPKTGKAQSIKTVHREIEE